MLFCKAGFLNKDRNSSPSCGCHVAHMEYNLNTCNTDFYRSTHVLITGRWLHAVRIPSITTLLLVNVSFHITCMHNVHGNGCQGYIYFITHTSTESYPLVHAYHPDSCTLLGINTKLLSICSFTHVQRNNNSEASMGNLSIPSYNPSNW